MNYYANGSIAPVVIDGTGVGSYDGGRGWEAEHYFSIREDEDASDAAVAASSLRGTATASMLQFLTARPVARNYKGHSDDGSRFFTRGITPNTVVAYPHVRLPSPARDTPHHDGSTSSSSGLVLTVTASNSHSSATIVTVRSGSSGGAILCTLVIESTGSSDSFTNHSCVMQQTDAAALTAAGELNLVFTFEQIGDDAASNTDALQAVAMDSMRMEWA